MKYFCLLRGINVSGKKLIKMEYLREVFTQMSFSNVKSFIQSGNIVFESEESIEISLISQIQKQLTTCFGYSITIFLRKAEEWEKIINKNPYPPLINHANFKYYITFLPSVPSVELQSKITLLSNENEKFYTQGREIYTMLTKDNTAKQLFSNNYMEKILKMPATTRNWNTVTKLLDY